MGVTVYAHAVSLLTETVKLKVENSARTTVRFSPVGFRKPHIMYFT